jgi:hypothetical protein
MPAPVACGRWSRISVLGAALAAGCLSACGGNIDVGSDVLWTARFEGGTFGEWIDAPGGGASASSATGSVAVSVEHAHTGLMAAKLSIEAPSGAGAQGAGMSRKGDLPAAGYYSAWYYLPQTVSVGQYWVIFKFRLRAVADDPSTEGELFDVGLVNDASGEMTLQLYDHRVDAPVPLSVAGLVVPVGVWFQIEAYYRNASDSTGALTVWFDGQAVADLEGAATSPTPWVEWDVLNLGNDLTPSAVTLFVDDCALSRERVGPDGRIGD